MGSKFLGQGGATDLSALTTGTFFLDVGDVIDRDLAVDGPVRALNRRLVVGQIGKNDLSFTALSDPFDGILRVRDLTTAYDTAPVGLNSFVASTSGKLTNQTATPGTTTFVGALEADTVKGVLSTGVQPNISSIGTLTGLSTQGNINLLTPGATVGGIDLAATVGAYPSNLPSLTTAEVDQVGNIDGTSISTGSWAVVGGLNQDLATTDTPSFAGLNVDGKVFLRDDTLAILEASNLAGTLTVPLEIGASEMLVPRTLTNNTDTSSLLTLLTRGQVMAEIAAAEPQPLGPADAPTFASALIEGDLRLEADGVDPKVVILGSSTVLRLEPSGTEARIVSTTGIAPRPLQLEASQVSTTAPFTASTVTASTVTATSLMVAPNLLGPVLAYGADIKNASSSDYLVANGRGDGTSLSAVTAWLGHVCPCAGALSVSYSKSSPDVHDFILSVLDPVTLAVLGSRPLSLVGVAGTDPIQLGAVVQVGDLLVLQHDPSGTPATAPGETVINVYLRPLGNVAPALVRATATDTPCRVKTAGPQTATRHEVPVKEEWEVV